MKLSKIQWIINTVEQQQKVWIAGNNNQTSTKTYEI